MLGWTGPSLPGLSSLAGLMQHCRAAILNAWCGKVSADPCVRKGRRGGLLLDIAGSTRPVFGKEMRHCLVVFWLMGCGTGFNCRGFGVS